jgi:DNA segregation ATPase FtsK/SpoIIIE-like protein
VAAATLGQGDAEADPLYDQAVAIVLKTRRPRSRWCSGICASATTAPRA